MEGVGDFFLDQVVDAVDLFPDALQVQPALHDLHAQVVFLVDHQAVFFAGVDDHRPGALAFGVFAADKVPFDEELPVDLFQLFHVEIEDFVLRNHFEYAIVQGLFDVEPVLGRGAVDEGIIGQIPRQADAAADDDVRLRARRRGATRRCFLSNRSVPLAKPLKGVRNLF